MIDRNAGIAKVTQIASSISQITQIVVILQSSVAFN